MPSGLVVSLYDEKTQILTVCCTICGAMEILDMSPLDGEDEAAIQLEHSMNCFVDMVDVKKYN